MTLGFALMVFGILFEIKSVQFFSKVKDALSWPATEGKVISSIVETYRGYEKTSYTARVVYGYSVNGTKYSSDNVSFETEEHTDYFYATQLVSKYPVDKLVTVYYQPDDPSIAVLELSEEPYVSVVAVLFFVGIGLLILIFGIVKYQRLQYGGASLYNSQNGSGFSE